MAHQISHASGRAEMAYAGETPWHGLGIKVDGLQTVAAMLTAAGLDWSVELTELSLPGGRLSKLSRAIVRVDQGLEIGRATPKYVPIQNAQGGEIVDALVTEGGAHVEVAGALGSGERCWMLAHIPADFEVKPGDAIRPYFLLAWGHDGKHGVAGKLTTVRVVCANTLAAAGFGGAGAKWSESADIYIRHHGQVSIRLDEARRALGLARRDIAATTAAYQAMAARELSVDEVRAYFAACFPYPKDAEQEAEARERVDAQRAIVAELLERGRGAELAGRTAWGAYNAVTEWTDHVYPVLKSGAISQIRQRSVLFGAYGELKRRAFASAVELVA